MKYTPVNPPFTYYGESYHAVEFMSMLPQLKVSVRAEDMQELYILKRMTDMSAGDQNGGILFKTLIKRLL